MVGIPSTFVNDIPTEGIQIGSVITSSPLRSIANGQAYVAGFISQTGGHWQKEVTQLGGAVPTLGPLAEVLKGHSATDEIFYKVSDVAQHLQLHMQVQTAETDPANLLEIWVSYLSGGASVDGTSGSPATIWASNNLPSSRTSVNQTYLYPTKMLTTGIIPVDPAVGGEIGRPLNIIAARGQWVIISIRQFGCRVLSTDIQEIWEDL